MSVSLGSPDDAEIYFFDAPRPNFSSNLSAKSGLSRSISICFSLGSGVRYLSDAPSPYFKSNLSAKSGLFCSIWMCSSLGSFELEEEERPLEGGVRSLAPEEERALAPDEERPRFGLLSSICRPFPIRTFHQICLQSQGGPAAFECALR